jgi:hypothetical protein
MNLFEAPQKTQWNVLNLGAGVQSSCLALMAAKGEITPMPDFAVFADTQAEPQSVYDWLDWLETQLPYPVFRISAGDLTLDQLTPKTRSSKMKDGVFREGSYLKRLIPVFGIHNGSKTAAIGRKCTSDYKIIPILKEIKKRCLVKRGQKETTVTQWIGISWDEIQRAKPSRDKWTQHYFPLLDKKITRAKCQEWMKENGYPEPPRSACFYCPFHSDNEWRRLRDEDPNYFKRAIDFDHQLRAAFKKYDKNMQMEVYLHNSCKPLDQVDFDNDVDKGQQVWDFQAECEGMCGV